MLKIYNTKELIPVNIIHSNDAYFDSFTALANDEFTKLVLDKIDHAEYASPNTFISRTSDLGQLNKSMLSTGTKTLLNIRSHSDKCFDVCECGYNILSLLPMVSEGMIYWETPAAILTEEVDDCDILFNNRSLFHSFSDFLNYILYEYENG